MLRAVMIGEVVMHPTIEIIVVRGESERDILRQRNVRGTVEGVAAVHEFVATACLEREYVSRLSGDYADGPQARVLAEQRRLRTLNEFHAINVEERGRI